MRDLRSAGAVVVQQETEHTLTGEGTFFMGSVRDTHLRIDQAGARAAGILTASVKPSGMHDTLRPDCALLACSYIEP